MSLGELDKWPHDQSGTEADTVCADRGWLCPVGDFTGVGERASQILRNKLPKRGDGSRTNPVAKVIVIGEASMPVVRSGVKGDRRRNSVWRGGERGGRCWWRRHDEVERACVLFPLLSGRVYLLS